MPFQKPVLAILAMAMSSSPLVWAATPSEDSHYENLLYDIQNPFVLIPRLTAEERFYGGELNNGSTNSLSVSPVLPVDIDENLRLLWRSSINTTYQASLNPLSGNEYGLGDLDSELLLSPSHSLADDTLMIGIGPSILLPTATRPALGYHQYAIGVSGAMVWQPSTLHALKGWTLAIAADKLYGIGNITGKRPLDLISLNPSINYTTDQNFGFTLFSESLYNWNTQNWTLPISFGPSFLITPGGQPIALTLAGSYFLKREIWGPQWGVNVGMNFIFD